MDSQRLATNFVARFRFSDAAPTFLLLPLLDISYDFLGFYQGFYFLSHQIDNPPLEKWNQDVRII